MVVARIGVAALAIRQPIADGVIVIPLDAQHAVVAEERKHAVGMGPEGTKVAQAENGIDAPRLDTGQGHFQGQVIVVDAAQDGDARQVRHRGLRWTDSRTAPHIGSR